MLPRSRRQRAYGVSLAALLLLAIVAAFAAGALSSTDAQTVPQKKLFNGRWYKPSVDLITSKVDDPAVMLCYNGDAVTCAAAWKTPIQAAYDDWNSKPDTARFLIQPIALIASDEVAVEVGDVLFGDPAILGIGVPFDSTGTSCDPNACTFHYGRAFIGAAAHTGYYGTTSEKKATVAHELGHLLSLRHESVNADESIMYSCGYDDTGPIPHSLMAYNCIEPVEVGGRGETYVHDFDVCGVNHAYPDAAYGLADCIMPSPTPTPSPSPTPAPTPVGTPPAVLNYGDVDCNGQINSVDALKILRQAAGLSNILPPWCLSFQGDLDCSVSVNSVDALKLLRYIVGLSYSSPPGCPPIGSPE